MMEHFEIEDDIEETITGICNVILNYTQDPEQAQAYARQFIDRITQTLESMNWQKEIELSKAEAARMEAALKDFGNPRPTNH